MSSQKRNVWPVAIAALLFVVGAAAPAQAQGRGRIHRARVGIVIGGYGYYPHPYLYDSFWYDAQWWGPYPPYYRRYMVDPDAAVRLEVKPREAEVYVDGYFAGIVDDFDGTFQRLRVSPGDHEIELYLDGYRSVRQRVYLTPDHTFKFKYTMERLAPGQAMEPRPSRPLPGLDAGEPPLSPQPGVPPGRGPAGRRLPPPRQAPYPPDTSRGGPPPAAGYGTLAIRVQPDDAEVVIDGETWRRAGPQDQLVVDVAEGRHTVEIRKPGYRTFVTEVQVRPGESTPLNVSLRIQQQP